MANSDEMDAFVRVVDNGSFAGAARELSLTPSAVSKTVTRLEQRLGAQLLMRTTRRLELTDEGETFLQRCRDILAAIESAEADISASSNTPRGLVRISSGAYIGRSQIAKLIPEFQARYPDVSVELRLSEQPVDLVAEHIDIAVRVGNLPDSTLIGRRLIDTRRVICASPDYLRKWGTPARPEDLLQHNCILVSDLPHLARWPFRSPEGIVRLRVTGNVMTDNADVMLDLAMVGHGIVRILDLRVRDALRDGHLVPLLTDLEAGETVPIWAVTPPERNRVPRVRAVMDFFIEKFEGLSRSG